MGRGIRSDMLGMVMVVVLVVIAWSAYVKNPRNQVKETPYSQFLVAVKAGKVKSLVILQKDMQQVREMAGKIKKAFGRLDVIINNAGITKDNLLLKQTEPEWDSILRTNLKGCFNVIRTMSPLMIQSGGGHIINIASYSGVKGKAGQAAYSASKAALLGLTLSAARELSEYNIKVNALLPGYLMTEMGMKAQKAAEKAKEESILNTLSQPQEVADFILFLVKTKSITGQVFSLDSRII